MAMTNHERVGKAMDLLRDGIGPFVEREFVNIHRNRAADIARSYFNTDSRLSTDGQMTEWDVAALLSLMVYSWQDVFRQTLGHTERSLVSELLEWRNGWAHQSRFSGDDAERALDSAARLLTAISAPQAGEISKLRSELRRLVIRRAGAQREASCRWLTHRVCRRDLTEAVAGSSHTARRRGQWPLPAG